MFRYTPVLIGIVAGLVVAVSTTTLTAAYGHATWRNDTYDTFSPIASHLESGNFEARPAGSLRTFYVPKTLHSTGLSSVRTLKGHETLNVANSSIVSTGPVVVGATSALPPFARATWKNEINETANHMVDIAAAFQGIVCDEKSRLELPGRKNASFNITSKIACGDTAHDCVAMLTSTGILAIDLLDNSALFLNTTFLNYMLIDYANATVMVVTAPATSSKTPGTRWRRVVDKINNWLPYVEALGILTILWKVGEFIYRKLQRYRGRHIQSDTSDDSR